MIAKIKDNLGLIATAIALMGTIGTGLSTAGEIVNTLQGIDDRMDVDALNSSSERIGRSL